ncbi:MarR family winged helix-turn-helix transcriptional regulator [Acidipropionibacterium jensenii]|uniref:MarR family winged helix-turn-helix transcriptional regulator n=1 Tax=Acidipropionibacterium jensenii TaxID=1749 RepID=UPI00214C7AC7|nr:MarR family transcriptional regulator [Acidipropionibacterium jensenii]
MSAQSASFQGAELVELANDLRLACQIISRRVRFESTSGIPPHQISVLFAVRRGAQTPTTLAERERVSTPAMTRTLNALEAEGLVSRSRNAEDSRSVLITLTGRGQAVVDGVYASRDSWMVRHLEGLSDEDLEALGRATAVLARIGQA